MPFDVRSDQEREADFAARLPDHRHRWGLWFRVGRSLAANFESRCRCGCRRRATGTQWGRIDPASIRLIY